MGRLIIKNQEDAEFIIEHPSGQPAISLKSNEIATKNDIEIDYEKLYKLTSQTVTVDLVEADMTSGSRTLTEDENLYGRIVITDTGSVLTGEIELVVSSDERLLTVKNETEYAIKVVTETGTGVHVEVGEQFSLRVGNGNVVSNGISNISLVLGIGAYGSGTYSYPHSLTQNDYEYLIFNSSNTADASNVRGTNILTKEMVVASPTGWRIENYNGSADVTVLDTTSYSSLTSFSVTTSISNSSLGQVFGFLKDGVTY